MFGQFTSTTQFYLYGRSHCTQTGWINHVKEYEKPDILGSSDLDLSGKVYIVTGSNTGIGREIVNFLARKHATCVMICRSPEKGLKAREEIVAASDNENIHLLVGDCSLEQDIRRVWDEFREKFDRLDALICNAGALLNDRNVTKEGVEVTLAAHLLFGTYLLGELAMPLLKTTPDSRVVVVSSGGMYNTKFPPWEVAASMDLRKAYDGQLAYAYAKRGQVLLCEEWARNNPSVTFVSCHPGWTATEGVSAAFGSNASYLEPLRTLWQGAEGIVYLCVAPSEKLRSGEFYLDRSPRKKHMAGPFFSEGSFTKNSAAEIRSMMDHLQQWSRAATRPSVDDLTSRGSAVGNSSASSGVCVVS